MITIYKSTSEGLLTIDDFVAGSWVHVSNPSNQELALLVERFGIPLDFLTDPLDLDERARLETEDGARLIVLRVPHLDSWTDDIPVTTLPLGIVLACRTQVAVDEGLHELLDLVVLQMACQDCHTLALKMPPRHPYPHQQQQAQTPVIHAFPFCVCVDRTG